MRSKYSQWYSQRRWRAMRLRQLQREPICRYCAESSIVEVATHVDHIKPHRGDESLFWDESNLQSLCATCHSSVKQSADKTGKLKPAIGVDGWPIEPGGTK